MEIYSGTLISPCSGLSVQPEHPGRALEERISVGFWLEAISAGSCFFS